MVLSQNVEFFFKLFLVHLKFQTHKHMHDWYISISLYLRTISHPKHRERKQGFLYKINVLQNFEDTFVLSAITATAQNINFIKIILGI